MDRACVERAILVGCGVAGPVLGMFLRRLGVDVVICEARPAETQREGAFLGVAPNGMNVLAELGVHPDIEDIAFPCHRFDFLNSNGQRIGIIDRSQDERQFGARLQMIRRADLHRALTRAALERGVEARFERSLTDIDTREPDTVIARFSDGSVLQGDVLVGCDGLRSTTRRLALPEAPEPGYSGLLDFGGFAPDIDAPLEEGVNVMVFGRRAFFGAFRTPSGEIWWFHNGGASHLDASIARTATSAYRERILELHRDDPPWIAQIVRSTPELLGPWPLHDILTMPRWHRGRVGLIGDAAHATTPSAGQGASLAMEDAMVLARCLRDAREPVSAFAAFERARRARVEEIVAQSRRNGNGKAVSGPIQEWLRDRLLPLFLRLGARGQDRCYAYRIDWREGRSP